MLSKSSPHRNSQTAAVRSTTNIFKKKIHFNEANIHATHNVLLHDYGLIKVSNTTFPRLRSYLNVRLNEHLNDKDNNALPNDSDEDDEKSKSFSMSESQTPVETFGNYSEKRCKEEFYRKRKLFNQGEFIVTKQKLMSREIPGPGPSIGGKWSRLGDKGGVITRSSLKFFMSEEQLPPNHSGINRETLREITEQVLFNTQPNEEK